MLWASLKKLSSFDRRVLLFRSRKCSKASLIGLAVVGKGKVLCPFKVCP